MNLEIRNMEVRSVDTDKREITGLAVPYGQVTDIGGYKERFEKGAFGKATDVKLFYGHSEPIGLVTKGDDSDEGYVITARISNTARGDEVYTLLKDGVLNRFSVGFLPGEHRMDDDVVVRTKATLKEVSVVAFPAYEGAKVSEVREDTQINKNKEDINMSEEIVYAPESEVADLRGSVEDLERRFAMIGESKESNVVAFRSGGEFLKALASGSREARDFATTVEADVTRPGWVSEALRRKVENRPTINLFSKGALPASGNTIEYPRIKSETGTVTEQATEGADLAYMEVALETATAAVKTYGGYTSLSRQAIERSDLAFLETSLGHMVNQYAKATEKAVRDALVANKALYNTATLAADTATGWIDAVVDASAEIEENGLGNAEFAVVSLDVFKRIAHMVDGSGRPLFSIAGQSVNSLGDTNLVTPRASIGGLPVVVNPSLAANTMFVADSDAIKTFESAGAPFRLQDENIINLTKDFSLYGYQAVAVLNPKNIVSVDVDLVA